MHYYFPFSQYIDMARALSGKAGMAKRENELFSQLRVFSWTK